MEDDCKYIYHYCVSDGAMTSGGIFKPSSKIVDMAGYYQLLEAILDKGIGLNPDTAVILSLSYLGEKECETKTA